ncbi:uncharacterized protein B0T23DRAFT_419547 [Neurospora hispaniola]|uniref:Uncharacterized protein n=1 Tax=Neurospora hispaniola TaxID=588809 RepID=A0AAJ0IAG2_9PEZI|nr:hypothetical protein B0T23DRAFT_419547 [Neurospora hispaniola]
MSNTDGHRGAITSKTGLGCLVDQYRARIWLQLNEPLPYTIVCRLRRPLELPSYSMPKSRYSPWKELPASSYLRSSSVYLETTADGGQQDTAGRLRRGEGLYATVGINDQMGHSWVWVNGEVCKFVPTVVGDSLTSLLRTPLATETSSNQSRKSRVTDMQRVESDGLGHLESHLQKPRDKTTYRLQAPGLAEHRIRGWPAWARLQQPLPETRYVRCSVECGSARFAPPFHCQLWTTFGIGGQTSSCPRSSVPYPLDFTASRNAGSLPFLASMVTITKTACQMPPGWMMSQCQYAEE